MQMISKGGYLGRKKILDFVKLSNGWYVVKTENKKSAKDFKVRTVYQTTPKIRFFTPKHAHFVIDFFGKLCANKEEAMKVLQAIIEVWHRKPVEEVINKYESLVHQLPGYSLEYILYCLNWILEQEDVNFTERPQERQQEINEIFQKCKIEPPPNRLGSQLAISLFCDVALGRHPVEAFMRANLDVQPVKKR
jgi:hypothetical protein